MPRTVFFADFMPDWLDALLLGLIEGLTEFIPVSSTGHLLIFEALTGRHRLDYFNIFIQCGAALALLPIFWKKLAGMATGLNDPVQRDYLLKLTLAFFVTVAGGLALDKLNFKLPDEAAPVAWATLIGAFFIFGIEAWTKNKPATSEVTWTIAVVFAAGQLIAAIFPGCSRSGATILFAMACGLARSQATEFSFLLGMPTLLAAGGYKLIKAVKAGELAGAEWADLAIGFVAAGISAFLVVKWLLHFVRHHTFNGFAIYRLVLGVTLLVWLAQSRRGAAPALGSSGQGFAEPVVVRLAAEPGIGQSRAGRLPCLPVCGRDVLKEFAQ
jgi:undecaprenyl-diphosphatase